MRRLRVDLATGLGKIRLLGDGSIAVPAKISRAGVLEYTLEDGTVVNEYRDPIEVFGQASLDSFKGVTLTDDHPEGDVNADTWQELSIGHVGDDVRREGDYVCATVYVKRADAIKRVQDGTLLECSGGYFCDPVQATGTGFDGLPYTSRQTNIRGNHVALGPKNWGRAGNQVRMYLDAKQPTKTTKGDKMDEAKKKAMGVSLGEAIKALTAMQAMLANEGGEAPAGEATPPAADASKANGEGEGDKPTAEDKPEDQAAKDSKAAAKAKADAAAALAAPAAPAAAPAITADAIEKQIADGIAIREGARLLGLDSAAMVGKSTTQIMLDSIKHAAPNAALSSQEPVYVRAFFDAILARSTEVKSTTAVTDALDSVFGKIASTPAATTTDSAAPEPSPLESFMAEQEKRNALPAA